MHIGLPHRCHYLRFDFCETLRQSAMKLGLCLHNKFYGWADLFLKQKRQSEKFSKAVGYWETDLLNCNFSSAHLLTC